MSVMDSRIAGVSSVCSTVCSGVDQRKHQCSASLAFVREIHRWPVDSPHNGRVTQKIFPFNYVMMKNFFLNMTIFTALLDILYFYEKNMQWNTLHNLTPFYDNFKEQNSCMSLFSRLRLPTPILHTARITLNGRYISTISHDNYSQYRLSSHTTIGYNCVVKIKFYHRTYPSSLGVEWHHWEPSTSYSHGRVQIDKGYVMDTNAFNSLRPSDTYMRT